MVDQNYFIRSTISQEEVDKLYAGFPNLFSIKLHHGGNFTRFPGRQYVDGKVIFVDMIDIDKFSVHELEDMMIDLGYEEDLKNKIPIFYQYLVPNEDLDFGLRALGSDADVIGFSKYVGGCRMFNVYTEHRRTNLHTYFFSPSKVRLEEIVDDGELDVHAVGMQSFTRLMLGWHDAGNSTDSWQQVCQPLVDQRVPLVDERVYDQPHVDAMNSFDPFFNDNEHMEEQASNEQGRNYNMEVQASEEQAGEDDDDSDFIVDEENDMDEEDVDMRDFRLNVDGDVDDDLGNHNDKEFFEEEILDNECFDSGTESDENETSIRKRKLKSIRKEKEKNGFFYIGQIFSCKEAAKKLITSHAVDVRRQLKFVKDDKNRLRAVCAGSMPTFDVNEDGAHVPSKVRVESSSSGTNKGPKVKNKGGRGKKTNPTLYSCPWSLLVSKLSKSETWMVRTFNPEHKCLQTRAVKACTSEFLSHVLVDQVDENPHIPIRAVKEQLQRKFEVGISMMKAYRAKDKAIKQLHGDYNSQYGMLRDYVEELYLKNPGSTIKIEVEPPRDHDSHTRQFKRIYVCLGSLKLGFKAIGRDLLGLDGAFMKGPFPGQVLTAVGIDPNNCIYPVCYAIVEAENLSSWTWFLKCLGDDLDLTSRSNFTFVSDRQKGILLAIENVFPCAEHRFCLRHIHENMKKEFKGLAYKEFLWKLATATTEMKFLKIMDELKKFNNEAAMWLSKIPPQHWSRSQFSGRAHSDVLLNNMCEVLNAKLVDGRDKPIITALEYIREYLMRRIVNVLKVIDKSEGLLTPYATKQLEAIKKEATKYNALWNGGEQFQVSGPFGDQRVVDMRQRTCACRRWEITGIPCRHVVAAIWNMASNGQDCGLPENWVIPLYRMETWKEVYSHKIFPINGKSMWRKSQVPTTLTAPKHHKPIGRPRKARKKAETEKEDISKGTRLSKKNTGNSCQKCKNKGHNSRTCKGQQQNG